MLATLSETRLFSSSQSDHMQTMISELISFQQFGATATLSAGYHSVEGLQR